MEKNETLLNSEKFRGATSSEFDLDFCLLYIELCYDAMLCCVNKFNPRFSVLTVNEGKCIYIIVSAKQIGISNALH